mmetsp:Transcript_3562/g.2930  ORF Transcript_3562/g.2930 Transcript_3562/m.2930 type:complete len:155 (-) Transcript_3562:26-490(-)
MGGAILLGGPLIEKIGRKWTLFACSPCFLLIYLWQALAHTAWQLLFARVLVGFVVGIESVVAPTYIGEVSPTAIRGALGACNQLAITIGILLAYALGVVLSSLLVSPNLFCNLGILLDGLRTTKPQENLGSLVNLVVLGQPTRGLRNKEDTDTQ